MCFHKTHRKKTEPVARHHSQKFPFSLFSARWQVVMHLSVVCDCNDRHTGYTAVAVPVHTCTCLATTFLLCAYPSAPMNASRFQHHAVVPVVRPSSGAADLPRCSLTYLALGWVGYGSRTFVLTCPEYITPTGCNWLQELRFMMYTGCNIKMKFCSQ